MGDAKFDGANLTDCNLSGIKLANANFHKTILVRTNLGASGLTGAKFISMMKTRAFGWPNSRVFNLTWAIQEKQ
ncbi:Pentapeptide repeats (8 copies) [compost metagenome]